MDKVYQRIDFHNGTSPALNETNLNKMSKAIDDIDDRVLDLATDILVTIPEIDEKLAEADELVEECQTSATSASTSATNASASATSAQHYAEESAKGSGGNALEYTSDKLKLKRDNVVLSEVTITSGGSGGTTDYTALNNKPSINNVTLTGNKSASDLSLATPSDVSSACTNLGASIMGSDAYNATTSYAPSDADKPNMCIDENALYKNLVACQGIKPSTDTSGAWERVSLESLENSKSNKFSILDVYMTNPSAVTIASGKDAQVPISPTITIPTGAIVLGIYSINTGQGVCIPRLWNNIAMYVRNVGSSTVTIGARTATISAKYLVWS